MKRHNLENTMIHGCALGKKGPKGNPQYKPWTVCTSSRALRDSLLPFRCKRNHVHGVIEGRTVTLQSAEYPLRLVQIIHQCFSVFCEVYDPKNDDHFTRSVSATPSLL